MRIAVGRVGRAHGVRGDVSVEVRTDDPEVRFASGSLLFTGETGDGSLQVEDSRWHSGRLLVRFAGAGDRTAAEALTGTMLYREEADRVEEESAWYDHDLIGCSVLSGGRTVGVVAEVMHLPSQDVLGVELHDGSVRLVPLVREFVPDVDVAERTIRVDDVPGLLCDADDPE